MKGYIDNIEQSSLDNTNFRTVLYTGKHLQLVVMSIPPGGEIGAEVHHLDQFLRCEAGEGKAVLDGVEHAITDGFAVLVPAGAMHNIINTGQSDLKLYTLYGPPNHREDVVHATREEAEGDDEEFDGKTTE